MAKIKSYFECSHCGHQESKWSGRCTSCGEWNSFIEIHGNDALSRKGNNSTVENRAQVGPVALEEIEVSELVRLSSGIPEFDRVLGGGILKGSSVLLGGEPGIGKSTLMLQVATAYAKQGLVLYISAEEVPGQIKLRADRLGIEERGIQILSTSRTEECLNVIIRQAPIIVIVDSIQTLYSLESSSAAGSPNQVKFSVQQIIESARAVKASCFFIAHVTKEGLIAGPKLVEHLVDSVIYFDHSNQELRFLRASKNRFGSTNEIGLFTMTKAGLREMTNPERIFIASLKETQGTAIIPIFEGSRILMVEIQALTVTGKSGFGKVFSDKIDQRRVNRIAAVIEKHLQIKFSDQDIYVNVAGGIRIDDVGAELGLAIALYSARTGISLPHRIAFCGEVSLSGRLRTVPHLERRVQQAVELGFSPILVPKNKESRHSHELQAEDLQTCIQHLLNTRENKNS